MKRHGSSRRRFLQQSAALAIPLVVPFHILAAPGRPGANDRVDLGVIGMGFRGRSLLGDMPAEGRVVAISDCYRPRMIRARKPEPGTADVQLLGRFPSSDGATCAMYEDYRRMIGEARLDAVVIAACDHHHVLAAMLACQAGLDVYCEKPLSLTIAEGRKLIQAVRRCGRVLQVGSQQRSMEMDRFACQFVRQGGLGRITHVEVQNWPGPYDYTDLSEEPVPDGMAWDLFCGPTPLRPYHWRLWQKDERPWEGKKWRGWDMWHDYSGHLMTNWGAHAVDLAQWALDMDDSGPVEIWPLVDGYKGPMRLCPVVTRYAGGVELRMTDPKGFNGGCLIHGERGNMAVMRNSFHATPRDLVSEPPDPSSAEMWKGAGIVAKPHLQNWIDCIKTRAEPHAPVEVGHRSVTICHLAGIARRLGRRLRWDPRREAFPGDEEANGLLDRPRRAGWELPSVG